MGFIDEFKTFAMKGSVLDLAIGFIMGAAFKDVVSSLVNDVIMPPIGYILGGVDFSRLKIVIKYATEHSGEVAIYYGRFINEVISFLVIAFVAFLIIKGANSMKRKEEKPKKKVESDEVKLLREIRDLLSKS